MSEKIISTLSAVSENILNKVISHSSGILLFIFVIFTSIFIAKKLSKLVGTSTTKRSGDPLLGKFLGGVTRWIIITAGVILGLYILGLGGIAGGLVAGAGISAFIVGFAFKDIAENFLAGIILAFSRPYQIGDTIESGNFLGNVLSLDIRNTQIKTIDGKDVFIPNSIIIKNPLVNYTKDGFLRMNFLVGVDYGENIGDVFRIINRQMQNIEGVLQETKKPEIYVEQLAASTVNIRVYFWIDTFDYKRTAFEIKSEAMDMVKSGLIAEGIEMPADIRELKIYREDSPIPLRIEGKKN